MTIDPAQMRQRCVKMMLASTGLMFVAVGFAIAHFIYGVGWALWGFIGFIALGFGAQLWFVRGIARMNKGG
jgi:hypothetical protein